jgi:hypothetical protein
MNHLDHKGSMDSIDLRANIEPNVDHSAHMDRMDL